MDRRGLLGLLLGLSGMAAAVVSELLGDPALGLLAGVAALAAAGLGLSLVRQLDEAKAVSARLTMALAEHEPSTAFGRAPGSPGAVTLLDSETGLPDEWFFHLVLEGRVAAARRQLHPLTVVLLEVEHATDAAGPTGPVLNTFVDLLRRTLRDADIACRTGPFTFGLILERTPEEGGVWAAERIQLAMVNAALPVSRLAAAVATYPTHGLGVEDVMRRAREALARATARRDTSGMGPVEIATSER
jgi:diguanylate cyclase (GGDEF)-like protein